MTDCQQYEPVPNRWAQFCRFWSAYVKALERYLDRMQPLPNEKRDKKKTTRKPRIS